MKIDSVLSGLIMECENGVVKIWQEQRCWILTYRPNVGIFYITYVSGVDDEKTKIDEIDFNINAMVLKGYRNTARSAITEIYTLFLVKCGFDKLFAEYFVEHGQIVGSCQPSVDDIFNKLSDQRSETILVTDTTPTRTVKDFQEILRKFIDETIVKTCRVAVDKRRLVESEGDNEDS